MHELNLLCKNTYFKITVANNGRNCLNQINNTIIFLNVFFSKFHGPLNTKMSRFSATSSLTKETIGLAAAVLIAICFAFVPTYFNNPAEPFANEWFVGADTYMRVLRVQDWWDGGHWYESFSARSNWPHGETLHWTRPFDILLMILAAPFAPFVGMHKALYYSGVIISPVLLLSTFWVMVWGSRPFLDSRGRIILVVLLTFQPIAHYYFVAARPDHHSMILFGFASVLILLARHAFDPSHEQKSVAWAGAAAAFGIWVSIESLSIELFALLALGLIWFWRGTDEWLGALRRFASMGALVMVFALIVERPPTEWLVSEEYDRLSTVHVALLALIALGVEGMWRLRARYSLTVMGRIGAAGIATLGAALVMAALFPDFFKGPFGAAMDPRLQSMWLSKIQEFQPLTKTDPSTMIAAVMILTPIIWLAVWGFIIRKMPSHSTGYVDMFWTLAICIVLYLPLTLAQSRWGAYMGVGVSISWALLLQRLLDWQGGPIVGPEPGTPILRVPLFMLIAIGHIAIAGSLKLSINEEEGKQPEPCQWKDITPFLNSPQFANGQPQTLLSFIHQGPEIIYRTPHRVIGTPYHRNTHGLLDSFTAFTTTNEAESRAIFKDRNVDYLLVCVKSVEERFFLKFEGDTLMRKITSENAPKWLKPAPLPAGLEEKFRLFRYLNAQSSNQTTP